MRGRRALSAAFGAVWLALSVAGCGSGAGTAEARDVAADPSMDASGDAAALSDSASDLPSDTDPGSPFPDLLEDAPDAPADTTAPPRCISAPEISPQPSGALPAPASAARGVDRWEAAAYARLRDAVLTDPNVHFVATWDAEEQIFVVSAGSGSSRRELRFRRTAGPKGGGGFEVLSGSVEEIFPSTSPVAFDGYSDLVQSFENPSGVDMSGLGYDEGDPRVGYLPPAKQSYPLALLRIASLFDGPDAPDLVGGAYPWAVASVGTHGGMGLLQSQSSLVLWGRGVREGLVLDRAAILPDVVPTALALLGAPTTGGVGPDGLYDDGLFLLRQDGRPLWDALTEEPCDAAEHVIIIDFDGLQAFELNHQLLDSNPEVDLPTFRMLAQGGVVYRHGAVTNFPSVSAPGHMTAGSGLWSGHHGVLANAFFRRSTQEVINPFSLLADPQQTLKHPELALDLYEKAVAPGGETLAQAVHRALGAWNPGTGEGAFAVVFNEIAIGGADFTTIDYLTGGGGGGSVPGASITKYAMADNLGVVQVENLLGDPDRPVPTTLQISLVSTDAAGGERGPNSDLLRAVLVDMDDRIKRILDAYAARGVLERTAVILTSDHGMELQDPNRSADYAQRVTESGVKVMQPFPGLIYLRTLELSVSPGKNPGTVQVTVRNHDNASVVQGALVSCAEGCASAETDPGGSALLGLPPGAAQVVIEASHADFNTAKLEWAPGL